MGDFNAFKNQLDKIGGAVPRNLSMEHFNDCITDSGLLELNDALSRFTWEKNGVR